MTDANDTPKALQRKTLQEFLTLVTEQFGQRPSFVTFERNTDGADRIFTRVSFYRATAPEASAQFQYIVGDSTDAQDFAAYLKQAGYEQQPIMKEGALLHTSFAAPESPVVDIMGLGLLIPRGSSI